ncbi:MAG: hypothetical protein JNK29_10245 [Anaerolineales bacterium]|nr:hypothetical protein [Anaerolineales bacterium]
MNTADTDPRDGMPDWHDPFGEPRTMPGGWDLSGLTGAAPRAETPPPAPERRDRRPAWPKWLGALLFNWN